MCGGAQAGSSGSGSSGDATVPTTTAPTTTAPTSTGDEPGASSGMSTGTAMVSTGGDTSSGGPGPTSTGVDRCADATCGPLDLLLIIDDSPSMAQWQPELAKALQSLDAGPVGELIRGSCDAHIGALATGALYDANPLPCQGLGSLVRIGKQPCPGVAPYATQADDLASALDCRISVGADGSTDERPIQALLQAMASQHNNVGACNDGFFRPDSLLIILLVTDEDDDADLDDESPGEQTPGTPQEWFDAVVAFKGSADRVVMLALTGDSGIDTLCPWTAGPDDADGVGAEAPDRLRNFIEMFPRRATDTLCQRDYAGFITGPVYTQLQGACAAVATP